MLDSSVASRTFKLLLLAGAALPLAFACGSDDDKIVTPGGDSGAGGAAEAGAPNGGTGNGGTNTVAGAPSDAGAGQSAGGAPSEGGTGSSGEPPIGVAGDGAGGAPLTECVPGGSVTGLDVSSDALYPGCRGGVVRAYFGVESASGLFQCCGLSTPAPTLALPLVGKYDFDGGVELAFEVPSDAAPGSYALDLTCPTTAGEQIINIEINEGTAPSILSMSDPVTPSGSVNIKGANLANVTEVRGVRQKDGQSWFCNIDSKTDTEINCTMAGNIPLSDNAEDLFFIDVVDAECGAAPSPPPFTVVD